MILKTFLSLFKLSETQLPKPKIELNRPTSEKLKLLLSLWAVVVVV